MTRTFEPLSEQLLALWHPTKNLPLVPEKVSAGSSKRKINWICSAGHEWTGSVVNQSKKKQACSICPPVNLDLQGKDLATCFPDIAAQWHPTKNLVSPDKVSYGSKKKYWWIDSLGHEWDASVSVRTGANQGCPYCAGSRILVGFNDLATTNPEIVPEMHPTLNGALLATEITRGSNKPIWWLDARDHEWEAAPNTRLYGKKGCPFCSGRRVLAGFNDLATKSPELISEWDFNKNTINPNKVTSGSTIKVWWICRNSHSMEVAVGERKKYGCGECAKENAGRKKRTPKNGSDLASQNPLFASQWHPTKNGENTPENVNAGSSMYAWWLCDKGHEWKAKLSDRRFYNTGCPICALQFSISKPEQEIVDYLRAQNIEVEQSNRTLLGGVEIDIYLPDYKFGIEFNGIYWHTEQSGKRPNYHYDKWKRAVKAGIQLVQIWEDDYTRNPKLIQNMLMHKIGRSAAEKIFARKTTVDSVDTQTAKLFFELHHIQGFASGSYYLSLRDATDSIVAVLTLRKEAEGTLNIIRYAASKNVVGGFTKLLKNAETLYKPCRFITFSDNCVSDGGLYLNNGFIADKEIDPDYRYVVNNIRQHKFGYRLKRFKDDPALIWQENLTEKELADLNNLPRIWDAGKIRWVKDLSH